jgi:hypothetical protein
MNIFPAFNIPVRMIVAASAKPAAFGPKAVGDEGGAPPPAGGGGGGGAKDGTVGAFITVQSLVSFSGATAVIGGIWAAIKSLVAVPAGSSIYIGLVLSLIVGLVIYYINISDPASQHDRRDKIIGFIIAILNTVVLFNATRAIVGG